MILDCCCFLAAVAVVALIAPLVAAAVFVVLLAVVVNAVALVFPFSFSSSMEESVQGKERLVDVAVSFSSSFSLKIR